ncbi:MAG: ABC transporter permease [Anaerolineales bacterium]
MRHIWAITRKEILHIFRDRMTLALVLFTPLLLLLLMAYALTVDLKHIPIAVLDYDRSQASRTFAQDITAGQDLDLYAQRASMEEIENDLMHSKIKAALVIAPSFERDLQSLRGLPLQIIIDGTEPESGAFAVDHIGRRAEQYINQHLSRQLSARGLAADGLQPIDLRVRAWYNPGLKSRNDLVPGLISMVLGLPALSVALTLAHEREHGTLEQLLATPVKRAELILGKMIPYIIVGLVNVIMIPAAAMLWFSTPFNGNFALFFVLSALFLFAILSMGVLVGMFMPTQASALALSFLVIFFPAFFLTGIFFPIASMPEVVRMEALALPGTHYAIITRGLFLTGIGIDILWPYAVMLSVLGLAFTGAAALFFRKRLA